MVLQIDLRVPNVGVKISKSKFMIKINQTRGFKGLDFDNLYYIKVVD